MDYLDCLGAMWRSSFPCQLVATLDQFKQND
jgi:hypothetical protein